MIFELYKICRLLHRTGHLRFFAAPFRHMGRLLPFFMRGVCGLDSCFAEILSSFSRFLLALPTFTHFFRRDFLDGFSRLSRLEFQLMHRFHLRNSATIRKTIDNSLI